jgi:hypothetical protein
MRTLQGVWVSGGIGSHPRAVSPFSSNLVLSQVRYSFAPLAPSFCAAATSLGGVTPIDRITPSSTALGCGENEQKGGRERQTNTKEKKKGERGGHETNLPVIVIRLEAPRAVHNEREEARERISQHAQVPPRAPPQLVHRHEAVIELCEVLYLILKKRRRRRRRKESENKADR